MATPTNPLEPDQQWEHKFAEVQSGVTLHYIDVGPRDATPLVLLHGWPDLWFAWRHQIGPLSQKYRVIVADNRGHGQSHAPKDARNYGLKAVSDDIVRLLDILEIPKAVFIGHDWGGALAWRICLYHPTRVQAVCGILTPFMPPAKEYIDLDTMVAANPSLAYMKVFSQGELLASLLDQAPRRVFTLMFRRHTESSGEVSMADAMKNLVAVDHPMYTVHSDLVTDQELDVYEREFKRTGFQSTLHWYATRELDFATERGLPMFIQHKALYIGARNDSILKPEMAEHGRLLDARNRVTGLLCSLLERAEPVEQRFVHLVALLPQQPVTSVFNNRHLEVGHELGHVPEQSLTWLQSTPAFFARVLSRSDTVQ